MTKVSNTDDVLKIKLDLIKCSFVDCSNIFPLQIISFLSIQRLSIESNVELVLGILNSSLGFPALTVSAEYSI